MLLILIAAVLLPSCKGYETNNTGDGYVHFIMKEGIAGFSFEYNSMEFKIGNVRIDNDNTTCRTDLFLFCQ